MKTASVPLQSYLIGRRNGMRFLNSTSQVVSKSSPVGLSSSAMSLEMWVLPVSYSGYFSLWHTWVTNGWLFGLISSAGGAGANKAIFGIGDAGGGQHNAVSDAILPIGVPTLLTGTYDGATIKLYVGGALQATQAALVTNTIDVAASVNLSWRDTPVFPADAIADDVRIYNRALSAAEAAEHAQCVYKNEAGLVLRWTFDEGSGLTAYDLSGRGNDGTLSGGPTYAQAISPDDSRQMRRAELWTFTLANGQVVRLTTLDVDVKVGSDVWFANGPVLSRPVSRQVAGTEVGEFEITVEPGPSDLINGLPWPKAAKRGLLRGGRVLIERVYMPNWGNVALGKLYHMSGRMAETHGDGGQVGITVRSDLELLNVKVPVDVVQPPCRHTLFDAGCTLSAWAFKVDGTVAGGSTASQMTSGLAQAAGYFDLGRVVIEAYADLPGIGGNFVSTPDNPNLKITGDLEYSLRMIPSSWRPDPSNAANYVDLISQEDTTVTNVAFNLRLQAGAGTTGFLTAYWTEDGSTLRQASSTAAISTSANGVKVTIDVDNGASGRDVKFWQTLDFGVTWAQIGATVTQAGVTSIFNSTALLKLGVNDGGPVKLAGKLYYAEVRNGIDGPIVAKFDPSRDTLLTPLAVQAATGETWTVSQSGGTPAVLKNLANRGQSRTVKSYTGGSFKLMYPLNAVPASGDTFFAFPGCDKLQSTCTTKFSNLPNFGGQPYVPRPETAL